MWGHRARRWLRAAPAVQARMGRGSVLIETALVIPMLLTLVFGIVGVGRLTQAEMAVSGVARETARAAALANTPDQARTWGSDRAQQVAAGYQLEPGLLQVTLDPGTMDRGSQVTAQARYTIRLTDLPFLNWTQFVVQSTHSERVDLYRSRWPESHS